MSRVPTRTMVSYYAPQSVSNATSMVIKGQFPSLYYIVREGCIANPPAECLRLGHWAIDKHIRNKLREATNSQGFPLPCHFTRSASWYADPHPVSPMKNVVTSDDSVYYGPSINNYQGLVTISLYRTLRRQPEL